MSKPVPPARDLPCPVLTLYPGPDVVTSDRTGVVRRISQMARPEMSKAEYPTGISRQLAEIRENNLLTRLMDLRYPNFFGEATVSGSPKCPMPFKIKIAASTSQIQRLPSFLAIKKHSPSGSFPAPFFFFFSFKQPASPTIFVNFFGAV